MSAALIDRLVADPSKLPPDVLEAMMESYKRKLKDDYRAWCVHCLDPLGQVPARHHELIISKMQAVAEGRISRLMIWAPPGSAKSTYTSGLFPAWFLNRRTDLDLVQVSHSQEMAERMGRLARDFLMEHGGLMGAALASDSGAVGSWRLSNGGRYYAVGATGSLTGRRADVALLDDVVKDAAAAESEVVREGLWDWYQSVLRTRLKPGGRIVLVMTRWHRADIAGRLIEISGDQWDVVRLPALAEEDDLLGREVGEPLWSDGAYGYGGELRQKRDDLYSEGGARFWSAMYQQNPVPTEGALFLTAKLGMVDAVPADGVVRRVRAWDLAATRQVGSRDPDWTVGVLMATAGNVFCVEDVVRFRGGPLDVDRAIRATADRDGRRVRIGLPRDPGQAGVQQIAHLTRLLSGYVVESSAETGSKETRAAPFASQVNAGNVVLQRAGWNREYVAELRDFPAGTKDDQVDASSRAFSMVAVPVAGPVRSMRIGFMGR